MLLRPIRSYNKVFKLANWRIKLHLSTSPTLNKKNDNREDVNRRLYDLLEDMDKDEVNLSNALSVRVERRPKTRSNNVYAQKPSSTIFWQVHLFFIAGVLIRQSHTKQEPHGILLCGHF